MKSPEIKAGLYMALVTTSVILSIFLGLVAKEAYHLLGQKILFFISTNSSEALMNLSLIAASLIGVMTYIYICALLSNENKKRWLIYRILFILAAVLAVAYCFLVASCGASAQTDAWVLLTEIMKGTWKIILALLLLGMVSLF